MKIGCVCGGTIFDQSDMLPDKAHFIADQDHEDFTDDVERLADQLSASAGDPVALELFKRHFHRALGSYTRTMYQCGSCARLYVDDTDGVLCAFLPAGPTGEAGRTPGARLLGSSKAESWKTPLLGRWAAWLSPPVGDLFWGRSGSRPGGFEQFIDRDALERRYFEVFEQLTREGRLRYARLHERDHTIHKWPADEPT